MRLISEPCPALRKPVHWVAISAVRLAERGQTKAYLFDWRPGEILRTDDGSLYAITKVPPADQHDLVVTIQKMVADENGRPLHGLREGRP